MRGRREDKSVPVTGLAEGHKAVRQDSVGWKMAVNLPGSRSDRAVPLKEHSFYLFLNWIMTICVMIGLLIWRKSRTSFIKPWTFCDHASSRKWPLHYQLSLRMLSNFIEALVDRHNNRQLSYLDSKLQNKSYVKDYFLTHISIAGAWMHVHYNWYTDISEVQVLIRVLTLSVKLMRH